MKMNEDFSRIESLIATWVKEIEVHTRNNSTDKNKYSEYISARLLNVVFPYNLKVLGENHPAVDLGDKTNGVAFQITSRTDTRKIRGDRIQYCSFKSLGKNSQWSKKTLKLMKQ